MSLAKRAHRVLVVFSGGQDSTTALLWAKREFSEVFAVSFDYGQAHSIELKQAARIAEQLGVSHQIAQLQMLEDLVPRNALSKSGADSHA